MTTITTGDGKALHLHEWPVAEPVATVAVLHGYAEHGGRYARVAEAFNSKNISMFAVDLRGHGRSPGARGHVDRFSDYYLDATALEAHARQHAGDGPLFLFAHSMGGLLAFDWLLSGVQRDFQGVLCTSPFFATKDNHFAKVMAAKVMSRLLPGLSIPLPRLKVTRDDAEQTLYDNDPLNNSNLTARWGAEAMVAQDRVMARASSFDHPLLLLYGGADVVVDAAVTDQLVRSLKISDCTTERLDGHAHELVNEPLEVRTAVIDRLADWVLEHVNAG